MKTAGENEAPITPCARRHKEVLTYEEGPGISEVSI